MLTALQVETAVNFIAAFVYTKSIAEYKKNPKSKTILQLRYADWVFTTPLLLLSLSLFLFKYDKSSKTEEPPRWLLGLTLSAAVAMCVVGYRAELNRDVRLAGVSFVVLVAAFAMLSTHATYGINLHEQLTAYLIVAFLWCCYGFVWFMKNEQKRHIAYNSIDLLSKFSLLRFTSKNVRPIGTTAKLFCFHIILSARSML